MVMDFVKPNWHLSTRNLCSTLAHTCTTLREVYASLVQALGVSNGHVLRFPWLLLPVPGCIFLVADLARCPIRSLVRCIGGGIHLCDPSLAMGGGWLRPYSWDLMGVDLALTDMNIIAFQLR